MLETKISVIIPVYNCEEHIEKCLHSVLQQTVTGIQVILVDDGSTDGSAQICKNYVKMYSNFEYHYQNNNGPGSARNLGLSFARGEYIGFVDSDDWIDSDMFELMYKIAKDNNDVDIVFIRAYENENSREKGYINIRKGYYNKNEIEKDIFPFLLPMIKENGYYSVLRWSNCLRIYKRVLVQNNKIKFIETSLRAEDLTFSFHCTLCANSYFYLDKELYHNRSRKGSISTRVIDNLWGEYGNVLNFLAEISDKLDYDFKNQLKIMGYYFCEKSLINEMHLRDDRLKRQHIDSIVNDEKCQEFAHAVLLTNLNRRAKTLAKIIILKDTKEIIRCYKINKIRDKLYIPLYSVYLRIVKKRKKSL